MIHKYKSNGYNIVLDVDSGSIHLMDDLAYDMVDRVEAVLEAGGYVPANCPGPEKILALMEEDGSFAPAYSDKELMETLSELLDLYREGSLYSKDIYRDYITTINERPTVVKALCLHIAHDCNLACSYCFAGEGEYQGQRGLMSPQVAKRALDFLVENSGNRVNLEVDFFGGEPLMNWDTVVEAVRYGRELETRHNKRFRFTLTTNGVLLDDEKQDFLDREMSNVVLSLDGRKEVHDRMRPFRASAAQSLAGEAGQTGSYDYILPKLQKLAADRREKGLSYYVRGTYTRFNTDFHLDVLHMADLGFDQVSVEPVVAPPDMPYAITPEDVPDIFRNYDLLASELLKREAAGEAVNFFHFNIDLEGGPCVAKRLSGCGSGSEYLAVTPWGDLYPCHQFVGNKEFLLGSLEEGIKRKDLVSEFKACNVYQKPDCAGCFARYYCSGGCAANAFYYGGGIRGSYEIGCQLQKKRVECAIMLQIARSQEPGGEEDI